VLAGREQLEDPDAGGVSERAKEVGLECLQLRGDHYIKIFEYI